MTNKKTIIPSLIENTTMEMLLRDGTPLAYYIYPNEGYVLHDKVKDTPEFDAETMQETENIIPGYAKKVATCSADYDFEANPREFYTVLKSEIAADKSKEKLI